MSHVSAEVQPIWFPAQRVIRSIIAGIIVFVPILNASLPLLAAAFDSPDVPPAVFLWVNGAIAASLAILGVVTRIMAIPAVNEWLTQFGAGSVPKSAVSELPADIQDRFDAADKARKNIK